MQWNLSIKKNVVVATFVLISVAFVVATAMGLSRSQWMSATNSLGIAIIFGLFAMYPKLLFERLTSRSFWTWNTNYMPRWAQVLLIVGTALCAISWLY